MCGAVVEEMTSPKQLEVLDLRHFSGKQLRGLLEQEAEIWEKRLRWEYHGATELLLQYLDQRILPGFVALEQGRVCGLCFCVYEGHKAVVGDVYAATGEGRPRTMVALLIEHLMELLEASPDIHRIEIQLLLFDEGVLPPMFAAAVTKGTQLKVFPRLFLELEIAAAFPVARPGSMTSVPAEFELCRWSPTFYAPTAELIQQAYVGHLDSEINDQYRTVAGSERFLHNVIRFPGCGTFAPESSFAVRERRGNALVAVILSSRVAVDTAHITQLCVAPAVRGHGLGEALLGRCLRDLAARDYRWLTLTVSEANGPAVRLYEGFGFRTRQRFDAIVVEKATKISRILPFLHTR